MVGQNGAGGLHVPNPVELVPKNVFEDALILDQNMAVDFAQAKHVTRGIATRNSALVKFRCDCTKWKNFVTLSCNVLFMGKMGFFSKRPFPGKFYEWIRGLVNPNLFHRLLLFFVQFSSLCFFSLFCLFFISFFAYLFGRVVFILLLSVVWLAFKLIGHVKWLKLDWSMISSSSAYILFESNSVYKYFPLFPAHPL